MEHRRPNLGRRRTERRSGNGRQCRRLRIHEPPGGCTLPDLLQHDRHRRRSRRSDRTTPGGAGQTATRTERRFRLCHDRLRRTIHPLARHRLRLVQPLVAGREGEARFRHAGSDRRLDRTDRYAHLRRHRIQRCDRCEQRRNAFVRQGGCRTARDEQHRERIRRSGRLSGGLQRRGNTRNLHLRRRQRLYRDQNRAQFRSGPYLPPDDRNRQARRRQPRNSGAGGFGRTRLYEIRRFGSVCTDGRRMDSHGRNDIGTGRLDGRFRHRTAFAPDRSSCGIHRRNGFGKHRNDPVRRQADPLTGVLRARLHPSRRHVRPHRGQHDLGERHDRLFRPTHALS